MTWEVHEVHERLYPDQGWTPAKDAKGEKSPTQAPPPPPIEGWPIWYFITLPPPEGGGPGVFPIAQPSYSKLPRGSIALRLVGVLISETTSVLRRLIPVRPMAFGSESASLALQNR